VAKGPDFQVLSHEICLQIAAMKPRYVKGADIPNDIIENEKEIYLEQFKKSGKPQKIIDGIIEGKIKKYQEEVSLLSQPWVKDPNKNVKDLIDEYIAKLGENINVVKFVRYDI
jgi:elongation factor Ts